MAADDVIVFADGDEHVPPSRYSYDDSSQEDDPAYWERGGQR